VKSRALIVFDAQLVEFSAVHPHRSCRWRVYALSGVGMVVLYRATGVLNLAFGAIGAMGALIAWSMINTWHVPGGVAYVACILFGGVLDADLGMVFGRVLSARDPLVKAAATLGLALLLLGVMNRLWPAQVTRTLTLPSDNGGFTVGQANVDWTQVIAVGFGIVMTAGTAIFLRVTKTGHRDGGRSPTTARSPPRSACGAAASRRPHWFGSGLLAGAAGLLPRRPRYPRLRRAHVSSFIFTVSAALIARLRSLVVTFVAAMVIGLRGQT